MIYQHHRTNMSNSLKCLLEGEKGSASHNVRLGRRGEGGGRGGEGEEGQGGGGQRRGRVEEERGRQEGGGARGGKGRRGKGRRGQINNNTFCGNNNSAPDL